jgi:hypothetical protein
MMANYAMVNGNTVSNIIAADDKEATEAVLRCTLIEITPENPIGTGWTLVDGVWEAPPIIEVLPVEETEEIVND